MIPNWHWSLKRKFEDDHVEVRGLRIEVTKASISRAIGLPRNGERLSKNIKLPPGSWG
jgi:hypothetical protein